MATTNTGSCLCGGIQYTLNGSVAAFFVCHCGSCQKSSGSAFMANCWFKRSQLQITQGQEKIRYYHDAATQSGNALNRAFCETCGSNLFIHHGDMDEAHFVSVTSGTLRNQEGLRPTHEVWTKGMRSWVSPVEGAERFETQEGLFQADGGDKRLG